MKRLTMIIFTLVLAMGMSANVFAMSHKEHAEHGKQMAEEKMHHGDMEHADHGKHMSQEHAKEKAHDMHGGHDMHKDHQMAGGDFVEIGKDTQKGVVATVKVKTYDAETVETMQKAGMDATHHVMVFFADEKSGEVVAGGKAAIKVKGQEAKPAMLMQMGEGFGADVSVATGMHTFEIGTKLEDGKKRQFSVMFHNM